MNSITREPTMTTTVEAQIIELHLRHYTQDLIVATLKTGKPRVSRCIKEFHRSEVIPGPLRIGRPRKRSSDLIAFVEARMLQSPSMSSSALSDEIATEFGVHLSRAIVNSICKGLRFKCRPVRHGQALNDSHKLSRLEFCPKMLSIPESLSLIHFSDESRLVLGDDKQWIWYRHGEDNPSASISSVKFPASIMIFAVIGIGFKSDILLVDGSIDTDRYIQNLDRLGLINALDQRHGPFGWIFQQDGAPAHTSQVTLDWLEESVDVIVDWPPNSPDLSPIEILWAILKKMVSRTNPRTVEDLETALIAAWSLIPQDTIDRLCRSFEARLALCLANEGNSISNELWRISDRAAMKDFLEASRVHVAWTKEEDDRLLHDWLTIGPRWKLLASQWEARSAVQLKNRWYSVIRKRLHGDFGDTHRLTALLAQSRRELPVPLLPSG
jgi:hypothetical protein